MSKVTACNLKILKKQTLNPKLRGRNFARVLFPIHSGVVEQFFAADIFNVQFQHFKFSGGNPGNSPDIWQPMSPTMSIF